MFQKEDVVMTGVQTRLLITVATSKIVNFRLFQVHGKWPHVILGKLPAYVTSVPAFNIHIYFYQFVLCVVVIVYESITKMILGIFVTFVYALFCH